MFEYCIDLGMSEDEAGRRLCAASVAKRFPDVYRMLDNGKLSLSIICKLKHYLTDANHSGLLAGVAGMSYRRAEAWLVSQRTQTRPTKARRMRADLLIANARSPPGACAPERVTLTCTMLSSASHSRRIAPA
jgi:hypothetical protein